MGGLHLRGGGDCGATGVLSLELSFVYGGRGIFRTGLSLRTCWVGGRRQTPIVVLRTEGVDVK